MKNIFWWKIFVWVLWAVFQIVQLDNQWDRMDGDDAQYILHAKSLIVNCKYNDPNLIYIPGTITTAESVPPGWPILLIPVVALFGVKWVVLKIYIILLAFFSGILLYKILQIRTDDVPLSFLVTAVYYFSMTTIVFSRIIYSEWPYMLTTFLTVYLMVRPEKHENSVPKWIWIGLSTGMALLCRSVGISLVLAVLAAMVHRAVITRQKISIFSRNIAVFLLSLFLLYETVHFVVKPQKGPGYKSQFLSKNIDFLEEGQATYRDILNRIPENGRYFIKSIGPMLFGRYWHEYAEYINPAMIQVIQSTLYVLGLLLFLLILVGFITEIRRKHWVIQYYMFFYFVMMSLIWFNYEVYRYLMPVAPFLLFYLTKGFAYSIHFFHKPKSLHNRCVYGFIAGVLLINIIHSALEIYKYKYSDQNVWKTFYPYKTTVSWLKQNITTGEIVIADEPRWYALETGLRVTTFLKSRDSEKVFHFFEQLPNSIIVFDNKRPFQKVCLIPMFEKYQNRFRLLQEIGHIKIYQLKKSTGG